MNTPQERTFEIDDFSLQNERGRGDEQEDGTQHRDVFVGDFPEEPLEAFPRSPERYFIYDADTERALAILTLVLVGVMLVIYFGHLYSK